MASVPKGFLRYNVLKLLSEKPMSGSEIMHEIEKRTDGHWKPSPGSIYPLLAWLQDKGFSREIPEQEEGMKHYILTDRGKAFLQEHINRIEELRRRFGLFRPPFHGFPWLNAYPQEAQGLFEAGKKLVTASWSVLDGLREKYSKEAVKEAKEVLQQAAVKMKEIAEKYEY